MEKLITTNTARASTLADKAAGYPSEGVFAASRKPSGNFTLRLADLVETSPGVFAYPVTTELEAAMAKTTTLTAAEKTELQTAIASASVTADGAKV